MITVRVLEVIVPANEYHTTYTHYQLQVRRNEEAQWYTESGFGLIMNEEKATEKMKDYKIHPEYYEDLNLKVIAEM